jgi:hypothetical protein
MLRQYYNRLTKGFISSDVGAPIGIQAVHKSDEGWKKWKGKVLADEVDIKAGIAELKREPKDVKELQKAINKIHEKQMDETAKDSKNSFY